MPKMIFVNLPVNDVAAATAFYETLGFEKNEMFSNEVASAMGWSDAINVMLLSRDFYSTFTTKEIIDAKAVSGTLLALSFDSRDDVDAFAGKALGAGGRETRDAQDMGFMYARSIEDLDGHTWEPMWMDANAAAEGPPAEVQMA